MWTVPGTLRSRVTPGYSSSTEANGARWPSRSSKSVAPRYPRGGWVRLPGASAIRLGPCNVRASLMASHSTRACVMKASHVVGHSTRTGEAHPTDGPRRMALSERMNAGESKGKTPAPGTSPCFVYILLCADNSYYVGCTTDLQERERIHNEGYGAEHTAARLPVRLVYSEEHESWPAARKREAQIKRWSRAKKTALIDGDRQHLHGLAKRRS
jgi:putative endonuclease